MNIKKIQELRDKLEKVTMVTDLGDGAIVRYDVCVQAFELEDDNKVIAISIKEAKELRKFLNRLLG